MSQVFLATNFVGQTAEENQVDTSSDLHDALEKYHAGQNIYLGYIDPSHDELNELQEIFGLHPLALEDSMNGHQRAKLERYDDTYFIVLRPAFYNDQEESIRLGETHVFVGERFAIWIVKHALRKPELGIRAMEKAFGLANRHGHATPLRFFYRLIDSMVDAYFPVIDGLENDGDEIEDSIFLNSNTSKGISISQRTYALLNQASDFKRAVRPVLQIIDMIVGRVRMDSKDDDLPEHVEIIRYFRDVHDHAQQVNDRIDDLLSSLENALEVNSTMVAERQNEDMKRISAWAAILVVPTVIGSIYGMNFDNMPELHWTYGYPASLLLMFACSFILWIIFKKKSWL